MQRYKLAFLISHPIQYYAPFFQLLNSDPDIDLTVYFCFRGASEEFNDPEFNIKLKWDYLPLDKYNHKFLPNWSLWPSISFFGIVNPGIISELKKQKYDAVIVHGYNLMTHWLAFWGAWASKTPLVIKGEADLINFDKINFIKRFIKKLILQGLFKKVDAFLYSYARNKDFFKFYGAPEEKLFFYPCAVNNDFFRIKADQGKINKESIKEKLGIKNKLPTALFVGKFIPRKRVFDLLKAVLLLKDRVKFNTVLVGDGIMKNNLLRFIKENNLDNTYLFDFKNQSELPEFYATADLLVLPSEYDPSPKVLNEAMNFSLPIIATDKVGTAPDLIEGSGSGFVYPVGDIGALSGLMEKLLSNEDLIEEKGRSAYKTVQEWSFERDARGVKEALSYINKNERK